MDPWEAEGGDFEGGKDFKVFIRETKRNRILVGSKMLHILFGGF